MHMLQWLYQERKRGLRFSSNGNALPIAFSDASNKLDPKDGLAQYGYCIMWQGAPIIYQTKKLSVVQHNAFHGEYCALGETSKAIVWMRQLMEELNIDSINQLCCTETIMQRINLPRKISSRVEISIFICITTS